MQRKSVQETLSGKKKNMVQKSLHGTIPLSWIRNDYYLCLCCAVLGRTVVSVSLRPHGLYPARLLCPWGVSSQEYWSGLPCPPPEDLHNPGIELRSAALQVDSLPAELPGKPKNTGEGSLSLLQQTFPTQESNQGLLHCRWILYHLS